jgi:hypothetical protein
LARKTPRKGTGCSGTMTDETGTAVKRGFWGVDILSCYASTVLGQQRKRGAGND